MLDMRCEDDVEARLRLYKRQRNERTLESLAARAIHVSRTHDTGSRESTKSQKNKPLFREGNPNLLITPNPPSLSGTPSRATAHTLGPRA